MAKLKQYMDILVSLKKGDYKPLYLLHGDEPYYIDKVSKFIEKHALEEHERDFNLNILYGRDLKKDDLLDTVRRFPMMAQRQVVIVREAQDFSGRWADLEGYFQNPMPSTVLVIDYKYKSADAKTKWYKAIQANGTILQSSKHYDNELPEVISGFVREMKYRINPNAAHLMAEYLGNDLEKIEMELGKLTITVPLSKEISVDDIHRLIGVSKEYNVFEYLNAVSSRDAFRSYKIAQFLGKNEKNNPFILIIGTLFAHFSKVMIYHSLKSKDLNSVAEALGMRSTYAARSILESGRHFTFAQVAQIINLLREFDARNKGVNVAYGQSSEDMLKELTFRMLN
jgi:DNA polymerase III subunit delta